jgi:serine/threonine protein kinase/tetratricopeptide (TPR) repeat protein
MDRQPASTLNVTGGPRHDGAWAEQLVDTVLLAWQNAAPCAEAVFAQHPELLHHPKAAVRLIYEEVCLRRAGGEEIQPEEVYRRFPQWRTQIELVLRLHSLLDLDAPPPLWPTPGETLGDFRLLAELGRGALGRVFLATQAGLADRPVVLKLTPCAGQEHLSLARLQHTHIVPLYTAYEDEDRNLRVLCMPYFGGATLHELLRALRDTPPEARTGPQLPDALDRLQARWPLAPAPRGPARELLARLSYTEAVCWVGACLADALHYAHERGLVHLDVKPSNVLLAADGQPMLLDFHIAQGPVRPDGPPPEHLGGTPAYAAPEQRAALEAVKRGAAVPGPVDRRADVYALGALLYECLYGRLPEPAGQPAPRPAHVSPGLADILARALAAHPAERYATAAALAEDLRRHLNNLPLSGVRNRSLWERWRKWRRRRPSALNLTVMAVAVLAAAVALATYTLGHFRQEYRQAEAALAEGRRQLRTQAYGEAVSTLRHGLALAQELPGAEELRARLRRELRLAGRARAARQLHALADRLRFLCGGAPVAEDGLASLETAFRAVWDRRGVLLERTDTELSHEAEAQVRADLLDLAVVWADMSVRLSGPAERGGHVRAALQVLDEAEAQFGASVPLCRQRRLCAEALGQKAAAAAGRCAAELPPRTPWEHYALGRALLQDGALEQAAAALGRAVELQPQAFWPQFHRGVCAHRLGRLQEAATAFEVCIALAPDKAESYYNRGLVRAALDQPAAALRDYTEALRLNPRLGAAALNRGLLHYAQKRYAEAVIDFEHALVCGASPAAVHYNLALVHLARGRRADALASVDRALRADPHHAAARRLRGSIQSGKNE